MAYKLGHLKNIMHYGFILDKVIVHLYIVKLPQKSITRNLETLKQGSDKELLKWKEMR